jgi:hypothetical protein
MRKAGDGMRYYSRGLPVIYHQRRRGIFGRALPKETV